MPPLVGDAAKVTDVPEQIFELVEEMFTLETELAFTVTKTVSLEVQVPLIAFKIYEVVSVGVAIGFAIFGLFNPVEGLHK